MKKLFVIITLLTTTLSTQAQKFTVELWNLATAESVTPIGNVFVITPVGGKDSKTTFQAFGLVSKAGFAEIHAGFGRQVHKNLSLSLSVGFQNNGSLRLSPTIFFTKGNFTSLNIMEWSPNPDDYWWTSHQMFKISEKVHLGVMSRRYLGTGPRVEVKIVKNVTLWGSINFDHEADAMKGGFAIRASF